MTVNRRFLLRRRPTGRVTFDDFDFVEEPVPALEDGQALIRTLYLSLDPTNRIWMSDMDGYMPPVELGTVMRGVGVGQVVASQRDDLRVGQLAHGLTNWQDYTVAGPHDALPFQPLPEPLPVSPSHALGALGLTGMTAYFGLYDIGRPKPGETVVVSAAAGAVGSIVGQLAKLANARAVGLAGTPEKCAMLTDELGFDAAVNYKDPDWRDQLDAATPDGIDVDFENVGGEIFEHVLTRVNLEARVVLCGLISQYNATAEAGGPRNFEQLLMKRVMLKGFIVLDYAGRYAEAQEALGGWLAEGRLQARETLVDGLERTPEHLNMLFDGSNVGKLVVRVAEPA